MWGIPSLGIVALLILAVLKCSDAGDASAISVSEKGDPCLKFLLLGDWGKGGNSGYVASRINGNSNTDYDDETSNFQMQMRDTEDLDNLRRSAYANETSDRSLGNNNNNNKATYQAAIAKSMGSYSNEFEPSFVVALGDNFYTNGVSSTTDVYWDYLWTNVYLDYYASLRVPWYPVLGKQPRHNHNTI